MASYRVVAKAGFNGSIMHQVQSKPVILRPLLSHPLLSTHGCTHYHQTCMKNLQQQQRHGEKNGIGKHATSAVESSVLRTGLFSTQQALSRVFHTSSALGLLEDIQSCVDHTSLLMLVGQNRAKLDEEHVSHALIQLWEVMKFTSDRKATIEEEVHPNRDFLSLCVLAENKVHLMKDEVVADALYAAIKLLAPDITHSLIRELRNRALRSLDKMSCKQLSKLAVCLGELREWRTSSFGAVTHAFGQQLDMVEDIRELSAWMRECLPLASHTLASRSFVKAQQFLESVDVDGIGKNDVRRVIQTAAKVRGASQGLVQRCAELFLQKMEKDEISVKEICLVHKILTGSLDFRDEKFHEKVTSYVKEKFPDLKDSSEASLAIELLAMRADTNTKFMIVDKAEEIIDNVPLSNLHHLCHGLRSINYFRMKPLTNKVVDSLKGRSVKDLPTDAIARILEFLIKVDGVDEHLFKNIYRDLIHMLKDAVSPVRVMHIIYCISVLPLDSVHDVVFKRAAAVLPRLHTPGINQLLGSVVRISRRVEKAGNLTNHCTSLMQNLQEAAVQSINQITSVWYLNNIVDFLLEEGDQPFLVGVAMQRYSHILSILTPHLAVEGARRVLRARYLQTALLDEIAQVVTNNINRITPLQVAYVLGPFSSLNYQPPNAAELFEACVGRIVPFMDSLPAGYVVDVANICALSQRYPEAILKKIFSLQFLTRLDEELDAIPDRSMMYRRKLMYLNRSVALECPEMQVPWFHEEFCRDFLKSRKVLLHASLREVQSTLAEVLGGPQYLRSFVVTPYHYDVSFECVLDQEGNPLPCADYGSVLNRIGGVAGGVLADLMQWGTQTKHLPEGAQRVAVDYLFSNSYCANSRHALGMIAMKKRHLELMGYKYVPIPYFEWHSAKLSEHEDRLQYLNQLICRSVGSLRGETAMEPQTDRLDDQWNPEALVVDGFGRIPDPDFVEDPLVMKVLHTFDRIGGRRT